eukprot:Platyproteum_vivax@DN6104_c0_g1_i1.p2
MLKCIDMERFLCHELQIMRYANIGDRITQFRWNKTPEMWHRYLNATHLLLLNNDCIYEDEKLGNKYGECLDGKIGKLGEESLKEMEVDVTNGLCCVEPEVEREVEREVEEPDTDKEVETQRETEKEASKETDVDEGADKEADKEADSNTDTEPKTDQETNVESEREEMEEGLQPEEPESGEEDGYVRVEFPDREAEEAPVPEYEDWESDQDAPQEANEMANEMANEPIGDANYSTIENDSQDRDTKDEL